MYRGWLQTIRLFASLFALADVAASAFILMWLVGTGGYVACGRRMSDDPFWPLLLVTLSVASLVTLVGAVVLIIICSKRLSQPLAE